MENKNNLKIPTAILITGFLIAGAIYLSGNSKQTTTKTNSQQPTVSTVDIKNVDTKGEPFIGDVNAPVTMAYWYDYQCPFCQRHEKETIPQIIQNYVKTGKVKIVFKDFQFLGPDSQTLGMYSRAVWEVNPDKFYDWHKAVYDNQGQENTGWATKEKIYSITRSVFDEKTTNQIVSLVVEKGAQYQKEMDKDKAEGSTMGVLGTPGSILGTKLISGAQPYEVFSQTIDSLLN